MADPQLSVIVGAVGRNQKPKTPQPQNALARRWRFSGSQPAENAAPQDVIPLLDGWIRRLEREAGPDPDRPDR